MFVHKTAHSPASVLCLLPPYPPLPHSSQVWLVFRRYREFVTLRQRLKTACQEHHQKHAAIPTRGDTNSHAAPAKRLSERGGGSIPGLHAAAADVSLTLGAGNKAGRTHGAARGGGGGGGGANSALIASVETILSECRFPSRLALGRSFSLRQERRKALHAFLAALVGEYLATCLEA